MSEVEVNGRVNGAFKCQISHFRKREREIAHLRMSEKSVGRMERGKLADNELLALQQSRKRECESEDKSIGQ